MKTISCLCLITVASLVLTGSCNKENYEGKPQTFSGITDPADAGFDAVRLQRIDTFFQSYIDQGILPNAVTFVARHGMVVDNRTYGWRDREAGVALEEDNIFRLASQTKAITTVALLTLFEKGYFLMDDPLSKFIPEFKNPQVLKDILGSEGSFRWAGMYSTDYLIDPQEDMILLLCTNVYPFTDHVDVMYYSFRNLVYQALL